MEKYVYFLILLIPVLTSYPSVSFVNQITSKHLSVQDFSHIRATPSPNWEALPDNAVVVKEKWPRAPFDGDVEAVLDSLLACT